MVIKQTDRKNRTTIVLLMVMRYLLVEDSGRVVSGIFSMLYSIGLADIPVTIMAGVRKL
jgi:hypothetical protein